MNIGFNIPAPAKAPSSFKVTILKRVALGGLALVGLSIVNPLVVVDAGHRGVVTEFGRVSDKVLDEGLHFRMPVYQSVTQLSVRVRKAELDTEAATKDIQAVQGRIALNYHVDPQGANWVYQNLGHDFESRIVIPQAQEVVKAVAARYEAAQLLGRRTEVRDAVVSLLRERFAQYRLVVDDFSFVNFGFSRDFNKAVEDKQKAEQVAQKAKFDLDRIKVEAEQRVVQARAEATSIRIQTEAIRAQGGEAYVQLKAIEKWDGKLPAVSSGVVPMLDLKGIAAGAN